MRFCAETERERERERKKIFYCHGCTSIFFMVAQVYISYDYKVIISNLEKLELYFEPEIRIDIRIMKQSSGIVIFLNNHSKKLET